MRKRESSIVRQSCCLRGEVVAPEFWQHELDANGGFRTRLKNVNEGCEREPRVWRYHRWDSFTCAKMKEGIVVGCLLKVSAMASDDEGFALSVTSKLREFMALGYPAHVLNGVIGRAFARTKDERLLRARQCSQW